MSLQFDSIRNDYRRQFSEEMAKENPPASQETDFAEMARFARVNRRTNERLLVEYLERCRYDELIEYFTDLYDNEFGDEYFVPLGEKLLQEQESQRFQKLWRTVLATRKRVGNKVVIEKTMRHILHGLEQLGDLRRSEQMRSELELFLAGKKNKLSKPQNIEMDDAYFWKLISEVRDASTDVQERAEVLEQRLRALTAKAIKSFAVIYYKSLNSLYTWDLWGVAYLAFGGCSDDKFEYFRNWVISEGEAAFALAVRDPDSLLDSGAIPRTTEALFAAIDEAYVARSSRPLKLKVEIPEKPQGIPWEERDLASRFPKTSHRFVLQR